MSRPLSALLATILLVCGCGKSIQSKEQVQAAILKRLETNTGLDLKTLDVTTTAVSFDKKMAYATVAFHPKGDSSLRSGMTMTYTLEDKGGQWSVVKVGSSSGHGTTGASSTELPPGHPPVNSADPGVNGRPQ